MTGREGATRDRLTEGLLRRGCSDQAVRGILGGNFRGVPGEIWSVDA